MWQRLGNFVIRYRLPLLIVLFACTGIMAYFGSKVKLSYEFAKAIPKSNPVYKDYVAFRQVFGDDGNALVVGIQTDKLFQLDYFNAYSREKLPTNLIQAQRDYFGSHTYERVDMPGIFHTDWQQDDKTVDHPSGH